MLLGSTGKARRRETGSGSRETGTCSARARTDTVEDESGGQNTYTRPTNAGKTRLQLHEKNPPPTKQNKQKHCAYSPLEEVCHIKRQKPRLLVLVVPVRQGNLHTSPRVQDAALHLKEKEKKKIMKRWTRRSLRNRADRVYTCCRCTARSNGI